MIDQVKKDFSEDHKLTQQARHFSQANDIHGDLPASYHYWSRKYVVPQMKSLCRAESGIEFYAREIMDYALRQDSGKTIRFVSIGCGESQTEIAVCDFLLKAGFNRFSFTCIDIASGALQRAEQAAQAAGFANYFTFIVSDFQSILKNMEFDVVIANQVLHHIVELEELFEIISKNIGQHGLFLSIDMIGRNGHMLWPEALAIVDRLWASLPDHKKFNHVMNREERVYSNWDHSKEGNEGIRAQDILGLLIKNFSFKKFLAVGNLATALFAREFGRNFDPERDDDVEFIEKISRLDHDLIDIGYLKPVLMYAVMSGPQATPPAIYRHWSPEFCLRRAGDYAVFNESVNYSLGEVMAFGERNKATNFLSAGWSSPEPGGVWSNDEMSTVTVPLTDSVPSGDLTLFITAGAHVCPPVKHRQTVAVTVNGGHVGNMVFEAPGSARVFQFPLGNVLEGAKEISVTLKHSDCRSPAELDLSGDVRRIALFLQAMSLTPAQG